MGDPELQQVRSPEPITLNVLRVRNLKGQKGDTVQVTVKVEYGEKSFGESAKVECKPDTPAELNFSSNINVTFEDPLTLDELATRPALITVIEVLPKEKKKSEEKTAILGQVTVDFLPLLQGETMQKLTLPINPVTGSPMENLPPEHPQPEIDINVSVNECLITEATMKEANLMSVTVESIYSTPESWTTTGPQYMYTAVLPVPLSSQKENTVVFAGGQLKPGVDKEVPNKQKKWAIPGGAQGNSAFIPNKQISCDPIDEEDGDYKGKDDREHRSISEQDKNRATWNIERRCFLDKEATKSLQEKIAKCRYWPVEVMRTAVPSGGKGKKDDDGHIGYHGVVYLNLAPLLYPGVKRIRGAYKVYAYSDQEMQEKAQRKGSLAEDAVRIATGILSRSSNSPFPKPGGKKDDGKAAKEPKKGKGKEVKPEPAPTAPQPSAMKTSDSASEAEGPIVNQEGLQYVEAKSYAMIEINLERPLVRKRTPEELAKRVAEYIPPRPMFPKRTDGAERAVSDFHTQVGVVANQILEEFRDKFGDMFSSGQAPNSSDAMEHRQQKLIYHLNSTGKYFAFKEQLKHAVVKIVREKYLKTITFQDKDELQTFLSELYVYLVDQMHVGLNKVLSVEDQAPIPDALTDSAQLKHFAREAEVNENFDLAARYYQERMARDKNDPDHWLDYGTFCLYINDLTKAEECFKECVSIDQRHLQGLVLYGIVCTMQDKHDSAETFFEAATSFYPKSIMAWTLLGLFYDGIGNEIGTEMAIAEANKLNVAEAVAAAKAIRDEEMREKERLREAEKKNELEIAEDDTEHAYREEATPKLAAITPTSQAGSEAKLSKSGTAKTDRRNSAVRKSASGGTDEHLSARGKLRSNENLSRQNSARTRSPATAPHPPPTGGAPATADDTEEAQPPREPTPVPTQSIYMQVVEFLLEVKAMPFTERTLAHHLLDPLGGPSVEYHIALARLKLQKHQMEEAEESLKEALQFDHQSPDAWAILGHVKYLMGSDLAKSCYERTLAFVADASEMHSIYLRLASIYLSEHQFQEAKNTFLLACKRTPSCVSWLGVGIACYRLGEYTEAEDGLAEANILNNTDPEVWAYLSLICLKTGRKFEAEQSYKYAIKLNLQRPDLLDEIHAVQEEVGFGNPEL